MAELLQDVQKTYPKPAFIAYFIRCAYSLCLLIFVPDIVSKVWRARSCQSGPKTPLLAQDSLLDDIPMNDCASDNQNNTQLDRQRRRLLRRLALMILLLSVLCLIGGYLWYVLS